MSRWNGIKATKQEIINKMKDEIRERIVYCDTVYTCVILEYIHFRTFVKYQDWLKQSKYLKCDDAEITVTVDSFDYNGKFRMFLEFMRTVKESDL